jgi:hypothetical protein
VNKKINPIVQTKTGWYIGLERERVINQLKILMPVGIAMIIVALLKYWRVSKSIPTVN